MTTSPNSQLPTRYVPQMLGEMVVHGVEELWLLSYTLPSMTINVVYFNETLWQKLLYLTEYKYGTENVAIPMKLHPAIKSLKSDLVKFVDMCVKYQVLEVKSL